MTYRLPSNRVHIPKTKSALIPIIRKGGWKGTLTALNAMSHSQLKAILIRMRQKAMEDIMRKPLHLDNVKAQVGDTTKEGE